MKIKLTKNLVLTIISNVIIALCIFSVFEMCFFTGIETTSITDKVYYSGDKDNKNASLMINVYWGTEYLPQMLEVFDKYNIKTTFFVGGYWVNQNADLLNEIIQKGHEIGNHGYYHKDQDKLTYQQNYEEIYMNHQLVKNLTNYDMKLFTPPSGAYSENTINASENLGYKTIMWSKDTIDWRDKDVNLITTRATKNMSNGDFVLMHPTECTAKALENIVKAYINAGFKLCPVSENLGLK